MDPESPDFADLVIPPDGELDAEGLQQLDRAARAGHAEAACRLAAELRRCEMLDFVMRSMPPAAPEQLAEWSMDENQLEQHIDHVAEQQQRIERTGAICTLARSTLSGTRLEYFSLAAANGHVPTQIAYLTGNHLRPRDVLRQPALVEDYRNNALRCFEHALHSGDLALVQIWFNYSRPPGEALVDFLPPDWRDPGFSQALVDELDETQRAATFPDDMLRRRGNAEPTPEQRKAAATLYRKYFATSPPPRNMEMYFGPGTGREFELDRYRCDAASR